MPVVRNYRHSRPKSQTFGQRSEQTTHSWAAFRANYAQLVSPIPLLKKHELPQNQFFRLGEFMIFTIFNKKSIWLRFRLSEWNIFH